MQPRLQNVTRQAFTRASTENDCGNILEESNELRENTEIIIDAQEINQWENLIG